MHDAPGHLMSAASAGLPRPSVPRATLTRLDAPERVVDAPRELTPCGSYNGAMRGESSRSTSSATIPMPIRDAIGVDLLDA
jgi:hypothetical protein